VRQTFEWQPGEIHGAAMTVQWRIDVGAGVAAQVQRCDQELGLVLIPRARSIVIDDDLHFRRWQAGVRHHPRLDDVTDLDETQWFLRHPIPSCGAGRGHARQ
jgi:hypothetical protein